ncbi:MAG: phosphoribosylglycinamide formyltransferase, partial [Gammaproteobacteria bacterium]|nr:phosphoribosylglycinamide formyltransferase [Gammaproteobacteria bacterium]
MTDSAETLCKVVVLISGSGSNLQAIIDNINNKTIPAKIAAVVSDQAEAYGLTRARNANIATEVLAYKGFSSREDYDQALINIIDQYQPDLIVLAGFMRILSDHFVAHYMGRMMNIHPSLLPKFKGLNTHQR